jgi:hypothetical protein
MAPRFDASLFGSGLHGGVEWEALLISKQQAQPAAKTQGKPQLPTPGAGRKPSRSACATRRTFEVASPRDQDELDEAMAVEAEHGVLLRQPLEMPHIRDYRLVFEVIDARERTLQAVQALLKSIAYVRGNARALPPAAAHQSRGKLARVLARLRTQTTHVVELVGLWRVRHAGSLPGVESLSHGGGAPAAAGGAARGRGGAPEPFLWFGHNYLLKTMIDLPLAPLPLGADPLLLSWFHAPRTRGWQPEQSDWGGGGGGFSRGEGMVVPSTVGNSAESGSLEWYFDATRLHGPTTLHRMRQAAALLQQEAAECGLAPVGAPVSAANDAEAALGHEMSLLLYGSRGGYATKTQLYKRQVAAAVTLQVMARRKAMALRLARRYLEARTEAAKLIQRCVRRIGRRKPIHAMSIGSFRNAVRAANVHRAMYSAASADDLQTEDEAPGSAPGGCRLADEPGQPSRRSVQDSSRLSRRSTYDLSRTSRALEYDGARGVSRWSEVDADRVDWESYSRETTPEPTNNTRHRRRLVVLGAARLAMRRMETAALLINSHARARIAARRLQQMRVSRALGKGESSAVVAAALKLQAAFRSRREVMRVLAEWYERMLEQYASSRMAVLTHEVAPAVIRGRAALIERQRELRVELAHLAAHDGGGPAQRVEAARLRLWACEGEMDALQTANLTPRAATKLLRDLRRKLAAAAATLSQLQMGQRPAVSELPERRQLAHMHGVLAAISQLCAQVPHASLLLLGVPETLQSKSNRMAKQLQSRFTEEAARTAKALEAMWVREVTSASMTTLSDLFVASPLAEPDSAPAEPLGIASASEQEKHARALRKELERAELLQALAAAQVDEAREAEAQAELWEVGGALALSMGVHTAMRRASCARLRLVGTQALGQTMAVMQAQVGHRRCREVVEEINGALELLADVDGMRRTMARPTLALTLALPSERADAPSVLDRIVEDLAMWMGVPDRCFAVRAVRRRPDGGGGRPLYDASVAIFASGGSSDPLELGRAVLHERDQNALSPSVFATAMAQAQGAVLLQSASLLVPANAELAASAMALLARMAVITAELAQGPPQRRAEQLRGKLWAAQALQERTRWEGLRVPGDAACVDEAWNKGAEASDLAGAGCFCALCAGQSPPVLARHRFIDCPRRLMGGLPDFTPDARASVEDELQQRAVRNEAACCAFRAALQGREAALLLHKNATAAVRFLDRYELPIGSLSPPTDGVRVGSAATRQLIGLGFDLPRLVWSAAAAADEEARRQSQLTEPAPLAAPGGHRRTEQAQWRGLKALCKMRPREALVAGGWARLAAAEIPSLGPSRRTRWSEEGERLGAQVDQGDGVAVRDPAPGKGDGAAGGELQRTMGGAGGETDRDALPGTNAAANAGSGDESGGDGGEAGAGDPPCRPSLAVPATVPPSASARQSSFLEDASEEEGEEDDGERLDSLRAGGQVASDPDATAEDERAREKQRAQRSVDVSVCGSSTLVGPHMVRRAAAALGILISACTDKAAELECRLLPLALEMLRAPLPAEWSEVAVHGEVLFQHDQTGQTRATHPLLPVFQRAVIEQRKAFARETRPIVSASPSVPPAAARYVQFATDSIAGGTFFQDFVTGERLPNLEAVTASVAAAVSWSRGPEPVALLRRGGVRGEDLRGEEAAAAAVAAVRASTVAGARRAEREAAAALATARDEKDAKQAELAAAAPPHSTLKRLHSRGAGASAEGARPERLMSQAHRARERQLEQLRTAYGRGVAISLAHGPRPLLRTLEAACGYGIDPVAERDVLFLADVALSLPLPVGWIEVDAVPRGCAPYWWNELLGCASHAHPVDDFIRSTVGQMRNESAQARLQAARTLQKGFAEQPGPCAAAYRRRTRDKGGDNDRLTRRKALFALPAASELLLVAER